MYHSSMRRQSDNAAQFLREGSFIFRLPQTVVRSFATPSLESMEYFQANVDHAYRISSIPEYETTIDFLNKLMLNALMPSRNINKIDLSDPLTALPHNPIIDMNLWTSIKYYPALHKAKNFALIDYASGVYTPSYSDLRYPISFLRSAKRSLAIACKNRPRYFLDWTGMISPFSHSRYLPWFWKGIPLDEDLMRYRSKIVMQHLAKQSEFVKSFIYADNPVLILVTESPGIAKIEERLEETARNSPNFARLLSKNDVSFFVKPHRTHPQFVDTHFSILGRRVFMPDGLMEALIPAELFFYSNYTTQLVSEFGSAVFNRLTNPTIPIRLQSDAWAVRSYGLVVDRARSEPDRVFPW